MDPFWTVPVRLLSLAMLGSLVALIVLPMCIRWIDDQLGYFMLFLGAGLLWLSLSLGVVQFDTGAFVQTLLLSQRSGLHLLLLEPWVLILCYFSLSLLLLFLRRPLHRGLRRWSRTIHPPVLVFLWTLIAGSLGSLSVVVMAVIGALFFAILRDVTHRDYTPCVILYAAAIGLSALLTTVGEPLSLFIAQTLGEGSGYLLRTFGGIYIVNILALAFASGFLASRSRIIPETLEERMLKDVHRAERVVAQKKDVMEVKEALHAVEEFEEHAHDFSHEFDRILHSTTKLYFFVLGLLLFGEAAKPVAARVFADLPPLAAFFGNAVSSVADNALLGLLEIHKGMPQSLVLVLGISLALWGVGLVPGNVCNIVLKERHGISFRRWASIGLPCAMGLAVLNVTLIQTGVAGWLMF
ncbi:DUF1646 family protein [Candidatus Peregrinibacteria bacterium]|nr:DUF1646 family protein [Candidatus Peregrinibacteria bacterium]MBI3816727.1 DUF1646 family protein [Candidatus Peregrinibacteria bacterium]